MRPDPKEALEDEEPAHGGLSDFVLGFGVIICYEDWGFIHSNMYPLYLLETW